ncbi:hypothetical protein H6P81_015194 [Aristolochia fimbriata]|uniref:Nuclear pore protein n=1 Tax=Aristolochia fimbriata TaxID=158543 RepID=A0AAV7E4Y0_ARIFI|nr:hypothetical protein H6P81_015194 [Aristolochia fimbriata]
MRNLVQLEALSKKLESKTLRTEAPAQSIAPTRLLAREGINAEQLARDLKSFELETTFEDVFPAEATTVEEYLQQDDWQKEKRDFLQSLTRLSTLPRTNNAALRTGLSGPQQISSLTSSPHASAGPSSMAVIPLSNQLVLEKKAQVYGEVVRNFNEMRERGLPFKPATAFKAACDSLGHDTAGGKSVSMQKIWHLVQSLVSEVMVTSKNVSKKMSLLLGARRHLEWGHEKYILDASQSHPAQAALGGAVGNLQRVRAFLRIRLRDYGVLDFDAGDARRHPQVDTTWQQIYFCLRTGYYDEARNVAQSSRVAHHFAPQLAEWITNGGQVAPETATAAAEECEKMLRMGDRAGRIGYDKKKLLLEGWVPYTLDDLQVYLNKFEPSYYTKNGKDPLVYPYVLLLSIQLVPAIVFMSKETGEEGLNIDAVHIAIALVDHGVLSDVTTSGQRLGAMDGSAEAASMVRQYGAVFLRLGNLSLALEYFAQAGAAMGGGELSWVGRANPDQQRQRDLMLKQLLMEILLRDGGIHLLLGPRGVGEEGALQRFLVDRKVQQQFLLDAARQCQEAGLYDKSVEIHRRVGALAMALETVNKCLSDAICALAHGRLDGESRTAGLIHSGNEILETYKYSSGASLQERDHINEQQTVLRQLEAILHVHKLARAGLHIDALRETAKLSFLPLDPRVALSLDNVVDSDGTLRAMKTKIANFVANHMTRNCPQDLYEKVARSL